MIQAQVQSGATVHQAMQPFWAEKLRCDSYAQDCYGANSRLSWEKNHGTPSGKFAQNHAEAPLLKEGIESDCGPSGQE